MEKEKLLSFDDEFEIDQQKAAGTWFHFKTARLRIASSSIQAYVNAMDLLRAKYPGKGGLESKEAQEHWYSLIARHLLLEWEGFEEPYSYENAKKRLAKEGFRRWVLNIANEEAHFKSLRETDERKN